MTRYQKACVGIRFIGIVVFKQRLLTVIPKRTSKKTPPNRCLSLASKGGAVDKGLVITGNSAEKHHSKPAKTVPTGAIERWAGQLLLRPAQTPKNTRLTVPRGGANGSRVKHKNTMMTRSVRLPDRTVPVHGASCSSYPFFIWLIGKLQEGFEQGMASLYMVAPSRDKFQVTECQQRLLSSD